MRMQRKFLFFLLVLLVPGLLLAGKPRKTRIDGKETDGLPGSGGENTSLDISLPIGLPLHYDEPIPSSEDNSSMSGVETKLEPQKIVYTFELRDDVGPPSWRQARAALEQAQAVKADVVLIHVNNYSGSLETADNIRRNLLRFEKPVLVYLDEKSKPGATALISLAADSIYMNPRARLGAATVTDKHGKPAPDHCQKYMRSLMRNTAEATSRNPNMAEAMASANALMFSAREAQSHSYCEGQATNMQEVLSMAGLNDYKVVQYTPDAFDRFIDLLLHPVIAFLLLLTIVCGTLCGLRARYTVFAFLAALFAGALYFFSNFVEDRTQAWELLLFAGSSALLLVSVTRNAKHFAAWWKTAGLLGMAAALSFAGVGSHAVYAPEALHETSDILDSLLFVGAAFGAGFLLFRLSPAERLKRFLQAPPERDEERLIQLPIRVEAGHSKA